MVGFPVRNAGFIPGLAKSPGVGNGILFQCSCMRNRMDRGAWQATDQGGSQRVGQAITSDMQMTPCLWQKVKRN